MELRVKKLEELKDACIDRGVSSDILNIHGDHLFVNCANTLAVGYEQGKYFFDSVGGSVTFFVSTFSDALMCAEFVKQVVGLKGEDWDSMKESLLSKIIS